mmetsp:Transcript_16233/g.61856  ORF Transcript_16233/g.61856 Transcript_16233/m.61856 type:complete len:254 (+) Transcript_16233:262-1023(+)
MLLGLAPGMSNPPLIAAPEPLGAAFCGTRMGIPDPSRPTRDAAYARWTKRFEKVSMPSTSSALSFTPRGTAPDGCAPATTPRRAQRIRHLFLKSLASFTTEPFKGISPRLPSDSTTSRQSCSHASFVRPYEPQPGRGDSTMSSRRGSPHRTILRIWPSSAGVPLGHSPYTAMLDPSTSVRQLCSSITLSNDVNFSVALRLCASTRMAPLSRSPCGCVGSSRWMTASKGPNLRNSVDSWRRWLESQILNSSEPR